jgi:hypothetical protein
MFYSKGNNFGRISQSDGFSSGAAGTQRSQIRLISDVKQWKVMVEFGSATDFHGRIVSEKSSDFN